MIRKVLLATDRSSHAEKTAKYALELAEFFGAAVVVMHAFSPPALLRRHGTLGCDELTPFLEEEAKELVGEVAELFIAAGVNVTALVVEGESVEAILRSAEAEQADLIVMGSRGEGGGFPGVLLGSVTERVVRHSTASVLVVK